MTTIRRRTKAALPRYTVQSSWCQVEKRYYYTVIDHHTRTWARGTKADGYESIDEADAVCAVLRAKEKL
jgi:hypothetical protein